MRPVPAAVCLCLVATTAFPQLDLTGDVEEDFAGAGVLVVARPEDAQDANDWNVRDVRFAYDPVTDEMSVGFNLAGDAADAASPCVRFDFDRDGRFDAVAGGCAGAEGLAVAATRRPAGGVALVIERFAQLSGCVTENFVVEATLGADTLRGTAWGLGTYPASDAAGTGVSLRVWAPFAKGVAVVGMDDEEPDEEIALARERGGPTWGAFVPSAVGGQRVKYVVLGADDQQREKKDPRSRQVTDSAGRTALYDPRAFDWDEGSNRIAPWNELVLYQLHVGSFHSNENVRAPALDQAASKLDYLEDLGINAIALLPVHHFPGPFSGGYDPTDFFAVARQYGGPDAFKRFVAACHRRNIAVLADVVYNHVGPHENELWKYDGWHEGNYGGIYFYQDDRSRTPFGDRLDYGREEVRSFILDNLWMYLCEYRVDGIRWDSTVNIRRTGHDGHDLPDGARVIREGNRLIKRHRPHAISIAEDLQDWADLTKPIEEGGFGFDSQWGSAFYWSLFPALTTSDDHARDMQRVGDAIGAMHHGNALSRVLYTENHDEAWILNRKRRLPDAIDGANPFSYWARKRSTLGAAILLTSPGVPMLFMGQEFYATGDWRDAVPMEWTMNDTQRRILALYKNLIALRRNGGGASAGLAGRHVNVFQKNDTDKVLAYHRWEAGGPGDDVIVVANFSYQPKRQYRVGLPAAGTWTVRANTDAREHADDYSDVGGSNYAAEPIAWNGFAQSAELEIGPYSALILSQDAARPVTEPAAPAAPSGLRLTP